MGPLDASGTVGVVTCGALHGFDWDLALGKCVHVSLLRLPPLLRALVC